ncbi:MAG: type II/IV secretion system protein [Candidatus Taylorbacteria bacterium]|nr:type II/IV secretion system protein [Candidatus Taylorbacteria bacterium]
MSIHFEEEKQTEKLEELRKREAETLAETLAEKYRLPYANLGPVPVDPDALRVLPEKEAREAMLAPFNLVNKKLHVGVLSPENEKTVTALNTLKERGFEPLLFMVSEESLEKVWSKYADLSYAVEVRGGAIEIGSAEVEKLLRQIKTIADVARFIEETLKEERSYRTTRILEIILAGALATAASDIHLEPEEKYVRARLRLDGVLQDLLNLDRETYTLLLSRIKLLSGLKLNVTAEAQDGRFSVGLGGSDIEIRTSILPGAYNESVVMRVLNPKSIAVPLEELGIEAGLLAILEREIAKPDGLILTTGPTGSGKTTTLYAFLKKIHKPEVKIITIEDPIEYHLPGIVQTQVEAEENYTFLLGLRSALRQDPDVLMVGEIRDKETAATAIDAALTGHLVFSTLHTNNAAGTFPRLIDLGVNPKIISSALSAAMAQRLLRKLCPECKKVLKLSAKEKETIAKVLEGVDPKEYGVKEIKIFEAVGCQRCNGTGYKGRTGVYEAILTDERVEKAITANPSEREIWKAAKPQGILSLRQDGIIKVLKGITSLEELARVLDVEG